MQQWYLLVGIGVGSGLVGLIWFLLHRRLTSDGGAAEVIQLKELLQVKEKEIIDLTAANAASNETAKRVPQLEMQLNELQGKSSVDQTALAELRTILQNEQTKAAEKLELFKATEKQLRTDFENLANRIFEDKSKKFTDQNKTNLDTVLKPLHEQLKEFGRKVEDTHVRETKERATLLTEVKNLRDLNKRLADGALDLTNALKGQTKLQGDWGEMILERILEQSGLEKGREYETQESFRDQAGKLLRPDVIVHLPEEKDIVVDSKVSLTAYEQYCSTDEDSAREAALRMHLTSIRNHVKELSTKRYEELPGLSSLNFVFMFVPIEGAFLLMLRDSYDIFDDAFRQNVMIVSPSTLMINLRTIESIWRFENRNRNTIEIAEKAAGLHDQFVRFVEDLEAVQKQVLKAGESCEAAFKKLATGRGNLVRRTQQLQELGVKAKKRLPDSVINRIEEEPSGLLLD